MSSRCPPIEIKCPKCGALASFLEPFEFLNCASEVKDESRPWHRWGGWYVVELFPTQFSWRAPSGSSQFLRGGGSRPGSGYPLGSHGVVQCSGCHIAQELKLTWPDDAYWRWEIRGKVLWAWDRVHAERIRDYVSLDQRPSRYDPAIRYIPAHFLSAKNTGAVLNAMNGSLSA